MHRDAGNNGAKKLVSQKVKLWERTMEGRLRQRVKITDEQFGFKPDKRTADVIFALIMLMEKYREGQEPLIVCLLT